MKVFPYILFTFCFLFSAQNISAQTASNDSLRLKQKGRFTDIWLEADVYQDNIQGFVLHYDAYFEYSPYELYPDSSVRSTRYRVRLGLEDREGKKVAAAPDATGYYDVNIGIKVQQFLVLQKEHHKRTNKSIFIPYYALNLPEGKNELYIILGLRDELTKEWLIENQKIRAIITKPKATLVKVGMMEFEVEKLDPQGESWDISIIRKGEDKPDLRWRIMRGNEILHKSAKQSNRFKYQGSPEDATDYFTISEGDKLSLSIRDYDFFSFSDLIGEVVLDPGDQEYETGVVRSMKFDKVVNCSLLVELAGAPGIKIGGLKLNENASYNGETGVELSFNYQNFGSSLEQNSRLRIYFNKNQNELSRQEVMTNGGLEKEEAGVYRFGEDDLGNVSFFIPAYEILSRSPDKPLEIDIRVWTRFRNLIYASSQLSTKTNPANLVLKDFQLSDLSIRPGTYAGVKGVQLSYDWIFPKGFYEELVNLELPYRTDLKVDGEKIFMEKYRVIDENNSLLNKEPGEITFGQIKGRVRYFIPFFELGFDKGSHTFELSSKTMFKLPETEYTLADTSILDTLDSPELLTVSFKVPEIRAKNQGPGPDIRWRFLQGGRIKYSSEKGRGTTIVHWPMANTIWVKAAPGDKLIFEAFNNSKRGKPSLGNWEIPIEKFIALKGKKISLKSDEVRKVIIRPQ